MIMDGKILKRIFIILATILILALLAAGCSSSTSQGPKTEPIKFGVIGPYTGPNAKPGQSMKQGVLLAVE